MPKLVLGFIEPKADFTSLIALIISAVAGIVQIVWFVLGSQLSFLPPQQVFFNRMELDRLRVIVPITFANDATSQYGDVVRDLRLTLRFASTDLPAVAYRWRSYGSFDPKERVKGEGGSILLVEVRKPIFVPGASSVSHEIEFTQETRQCVSANCSAGDESFLTWSEFADAADRADRLHIDLVAEAIDGRQYETACTVLIDRAFKDRNRIDDPWQAPPCVDGALRFGTR